MPYTIENLDDMIEEVRGTITDALSGLAFAITKSGRRYALGVALCSTCDAPVDAEQECPACTVRQEVRHAA